VIHDAADNVDEAVRLHQLVADLIDSGREALDDSSPESSENSGPSAAPWLDSSAAMRHLLGVLCG
jgi:hypothetical protein